VVGAAECDRTDSQPVQFFPQVGQCFVRVETELALADAPECPAHPLEFTITLLVVPDLLGCRVVPLAVAFHGQASARPYDDEVDAFASRRVLRDDVIATPLQT